MAQTGANTTSHNATRRNKDSDAFLDHYFKRIDPAVARSFTAEQRDAIKSILGARGMAKHAVEIRRSVPFGKRRLYFVFLMGKEHRSLLRLRRDGAISRPFNMLVYICLAALLSAPVFGAMLALSL